MSIKPRVSVIMAVYNEERFLAQGIESVLAQSFQDWELIVSDDGSTDATPTIASGFVERQPERIRLLRSGENRGKPFALNRALRARRGELIAWLDGDDLMMPDKLERQVAALDANRAAAGCCHDAEMFDAIGGRTLGRFSSQTNGAPLRSGGVELWFDPTYRMLPSATMIRSSLCPPGGFDERLTYTNDWLFDIEVFRHGGCIAIEDALVRYRRHDENLSTRGETSGATYEEGLMAMAIVIARYPELQRKARSVCGALMLGQASRAFTRREWHLSLQLARGAFGAGGLVGMCDIACSLTRARQRHRRSLSG